MTLGIILWTNDIEWPPIIDYKQTNSILNFFPLKTLSGDFLKAGKGFESVDLFIFVPKKLF